MPWIPLRFPGAARVDTVYFGGGTPTMLGADRLCTVLEGIRQRYDLAPDAEITLEANPIAITPKMAATLRQGGFNRISMGLQSASPAQLRDLGRTHTAEKAAEAVQIVRRRASGISRWISCSACPTRR